MNPPTTPLPTTIHQQATSQRPVAPAPFPHWERVSEGHRRELIMALTTVFVKHLPPHYPRQQMEANDE